MGIEHDLRDGAEKWISSSNNFIEDYVGSSALLAGRYLETLRKTMAPQTRAEAVDELLKTSLDAATLVPRLVSRHFMSNLGTEEPPPQHLKVTLKNDTPATVDFAIANETGIVRRIVVSAAPFFPLPSGPEFPSDMVTLTPSSVDLAPGEEQVVAILIAPSSRFSVGQSYKTVISSTGGLNGAIDLEVSVES